MAADDKTITSVTRTDLKTVNISKTVKDSVVVGQHIDRNNICGVCENLG